MSLSIGTNSRAWRAAPSGTTEQARRCSADSDPTRPGRRLRASSLTRVESDDVAPADDVGREMTCARNLMLALPQQLFGAGPNKRTLDGVRVPATKTI